MSNLINVNDELSAEEVFNRSAEERKALKPEEVKRHNLDIASVVALVLGTLPKIRSLRDAMLKLPRLDMGAIDKLEHRTLALTHAQARYLSFSESPGALRELAEEAVRTSKLLHADAEALASRGLINAASFDDYTGGTGYKVVATDLQILVMVLKGNWSEIEGKCAVEPTELERAEKVASRILRLVGQKMQSDQADDPALDDLNRAFTLVDYSYDEACRASTFLRWHQGDAEELVPSLYSTRKRHRADSAEQPAAPGQPTNGAPPVSRNLDNLPGGNPFIS